MKELVLHVTDEVYAALKYRATSLRGTPERVAAMVLDLGTADTREELAWRGTGGSVGVGPDARVRISEEIAGLKRYLEWCNERD